MLDNESEALTRKALEMALAGDGPAMRLCIERILPPRRDRPVPIKLPPLGDASDAPRAMAVIVAAIATGELTPAEAEDLSSLVSGYVKAIEVSEIEKRLVALEKRAGIEQGARP